ncbi:MAG: S-methyl-5-thioribose-1-phosphate isomerase [bacterium]
MAFFTLKLTDDDIVEMIDQRKLPGKVIYLKLKTYRDVIDAIKKMVVRGAPAIGVSAGFGLYLGAKDIIAKMEVLNSDNDNNNNSNKTINQYEEFKIRFLKICDEMFKARPTAVNLEWAIKKMKEIVIGGNDIKTNLSSATNPAANSAKNITANITANTKANIADITVDKKNVKSILKKLREESIKIYNEDIEINKKMGKFGASLINDGSTILTHCNAGALATAGYGTALGVIRAAIEDKKKIKVIADETRPFLQGARLTAWELMSDNIPVTLIADNSAGLLMRKGMINGVIVGADRIASNGDIANKIGTYQVAVLAKENNIPFYVAAPLSTIDLNIKSGEEIPIEERDGKEVSAVFGKKIAPENVNVLNYAFDITPHKYISAIITEKGIARKPYDKSIAELFKVKE